MALSASANPITPVPVPRSCDTTRPADFADSIDNITSGDYNLRNRAGRPACAGFVRLNNDTAGSLEAVLVPEQLAAGTDTITVVVNAGDQYQSPMPIKQITASGSGALSAVIYWWVYGTSVPINPA